MSRPFSIRLSNIRLEKMCLQCVELERIRAVYSGVILIHSNTEYRLRAMAVGESCYCFAIYYCSEYFVDLI